jgi:hypothetical protein
MESGTINAHKPTNHLRGDPSSSFVRADHIITEQDEQEGEEHPNSRELGVVASFATSFGTFECCAYDPITGRPYQNCMNLTAEYCNTASTFFTTWGDCHLKIIAVRNKLNVNWVNYVNSCAKWLTGNPDSEACKTATNVILAKESSVLDGITMEPIPPAITKAIDYVWRT